MADHRDTADEQAVRRNETIAGESRGDVAPEAVGASPLHGRVPEWLDQWNDIQARFVDEPRQSIESADALVGEVMHELTAAFADERSRLEDQWEAGSEPSTEDLRLALQHYRSFLNRLLAA
jgi:hypothetical protein